MKISKVKKSYLMFEDGKFVIKEMTYREYLEMMFKRGGVNVKNR